MEENSIVDVSKSIENEIVLDKEPILNIDDLIKSNKNWLEDYMDK